MSSSSLAHLLAEAIADGGWRAKARPEQLAPPGEWDGWLYMAGRGAGKTRSGAEWIHECVADGSTQEIALVAATERDLRRYVLEGPSGILSVAPAHARPVYESSKGLLTWPNGARASTYTAEEPDRLRGANTDTVWCDEVGSWKDGGQAAWDNLMMGHRLGSRTRWMVTTTPRPTPLLKSLLKTEGVVVSRGSTFDNESNLSPSFIKMMRSKYEGTRLGRQEIFAEMLEDVEGALWSRKLLDETRREPLHPPYGIMFRRVVVAVDPAVSVSTKSDETGIVVAGIDWDDHFYILADISGKYSPYEWAQHAADAYHRHAADRIVTEANQGGAVLEATLHSVDRNLPIRLVHASKGKIARAEPIHALFEQGRAHLTGTFQALEDQLCSFAPGCTSSPDRLDAMVWALTELSQNSGRRAELFFL